jgi:putative spermidine/putrescine transport system ATP-binding protein
MNTSAEHIQVSHLRKSFGSTVVLNDVSCTIARGELFFLLGASGSGKSTLLRIIAGLEFQDSGSVSIDDVSMDSTPAEQRGIGFVFQNYALWPHLNVRDHIMFGLQIGKYSSTEKNRRFSRVIELSQLSPLLDRYPHQLSGGQQQRVAVARALALEPRVLLLDEPLANLDPSLRNSVLDEIVSLKKELGITIIYVTHHKDEALSAGERAAFLLRGTVLQIGTPRKLYESPVSTELAQFFDDLFLLTPQDLAPQATEDIEKLPESFGIRPHHILFCKKGLTLPPGMVPLRATIIRTDFLGNHTRVQLALDSGKSLTAHCYQGVQGYQSTEFASPIDTLIPAIDPKNIMTFKTSHSIQA